jgi:NAD(P)-dependent dehydrogenase (short-subunit alcohol dehydrogenase family)
MKSCTAFVTGADRGLGLALAESLLARGWTVFAGRFMPDLRALDALRDRFGAELSLVPLDVGKDASVTGAARAVTEATGSLDLLVNNAAIVGDIETAMPDRLDYEEMLGVYNVNAVGAVRTMNAFFRLLCAGSGKVVVNISSEAGSVGTCHRDCWYAYCMAKAALNMASAITHNRLRALGGRVIVVHPGSVRTPMRAKDMDKADVEPGDSAAGILALVERAISGDPALAGERPAYLDYRGVPLPW